MTVLFDVAGIGNAIVDVLSYCDDALVRSQGMMKGTMTLIDEQRAEDLYHMMGQATECSGGSAANTMAGISSLGGRAAFIGKVYDDQLGKIFRHDLNGVGVYFNTPAATQGRATGRCLIFVTPDAQRTMNTYIGACAQIRDEDIDPAIVEKALVTYVEGYLWDEPETKQALRKAMTLAKGAERKVAMTLSDVFCVERHRQDFLELLNGQIDILFANEAEVMALFQKSTVEEAIAELQGKCEIAAITRSEKGSVLVTKEEQIKVAPKPIRELVDTTGAGDLYASGFLYGYTRGYSLERCGEIASLAAADIIQHLGARPLKPLRNLLPQAA